MNTRWIAACGGLLLGWVVVLFPSTMVAFPGTIDSDIHIDATSPGSMRTYFPVAGRLELHLRPGSQTLYTGTFFDYQGLKKYPASADTRDMNAPTVSLTGFNGHFVLEGDADFGSPFYSGDVVSQPKVFRKVGAMFWQAAAHSESRASLLLVLSERIGRIALPAIAVQATVTLLYDANGRISGGSTVTSDANGNRVDGTVAFSGRYSTEPSPSTYFQAKIGGTKYNISGGFRGTEFGGFAVTGTGTMTRIWVVDGTEAP